MAHIMLYYLGNNCIVMVIFDMGATRDEPERPRDENK